MAEQDNSEISENREESRERSLANLLRFQPGQSGNPGGRPKKKPITELYEEILNDPRHMADLRKTLVKMLKSGQAQTVLLIREMADRTEGKVTRSIEHSGRMTLEQLVCGSMELEADESGKS